MKEKKDWKGIMAVVMTVIAFAVIFAYAYKPVPVGYTSDDDVQSKIKEAVNESVSSLEGQLSEKDKQLMNLTDQVSELMKAKEKESEEKELEEKVESGYELEDCFFSGYCDELFSDSKLKHLIDGKVEFDDEEYDVEETIYSKVSSVINGEDFKENVYLSILEGDYEYRLILDKDLNLSEISGDEPLKVMFLGKEIEISAWDGDKVVLQSGKKYIVSEGETLSVDGFEVSIEYINEDEVKLLVNGELTNSIEEGEDFRLEDDSYVEVKDIMYDQRDGRVSKVEIVLSGDKIKSTIEDGDEYSEDSIFEYIVGDHFIGVKLVEDFEELDDRDGYDVLDVDGKLCLPEEYSCIVYKGISDEKRYDIDLEYDDGFIYLSGKFLSGLDDFEEIYFNMTEGKFYDEDDEEIVGDIFIGDSDIKVEKNLLGSKYYLSIDDIMFGFELEKLWVSSFSNEITSEEDNYRTEYGSVIYSPKDSCEDQEISISVPEERLEAIVVVY